MGALSTGAFWLAAIERAIKSFAGALLVFIVAGVTDLREVDWLFALSISGGTALASILLSVSSAGAGNSGPSLANEELKP